MPASVTDPRRRALVFRAFRLTGVVPLAAFLVVHAILNARALAGDAAFLGVTRWLHASPALPVVEVLFVFAPLAVHGAIGLWMTAARVPLDPPAPYPPALRVAMRATGVLAIAFLAMHLPEFRFRAGAAHATPAAIASSLDAHLSSMWHGMPVRGLAYLVGSACVCFHLAAGLWGFFATTPRGAAPRTRRLAAWWSAAVGAILWALFANVVVYHATGARLFGGSGGDGSSSSVPCPAPPGSN
ncbi:MAG TPA: hypothetical protein VIY73_03720 [Polyangiaceae bacterium]